MQEIVSKIRYCKAKILQEINVKENESKISELKKQYIQMAFNDNDFSGFLL